MDRDMKPENVAAALEHFRARWSRPLVAAPDVEERAAVRLQDDERQVLVLVRPPEVRLFVRAPELDRVVWGATPEQEPRLKPGWHSGYVHDLADVDHILDRLRERLGRAEAA